MFHLSFWQFFCVTSLLSVCVVANAFHARNAEFYSSIVYLTKSSPSLTVLYIQAAIMVWASFKLFQKVFFGQLRATEVEHVFEKSWYAITESALAFTVFRDEFSYFFVASFIFLLAVKCAHWIAEDRVELMERSPNLPNTFHIRMVSIMFLLTFTDAACVHYSLNIVMARGPSVQLVFAFEYAVLYSILFMIAAKYTLHSMDQRHRFTYDRKIVYLLYAELGTSFYRLILYIGFVSLMLSMKMFALFAIRPTYMAIRSFTKALTDVIRSRIAIRNLNNLFPDATDQDLRNLSDPICIICREEMAANESSPACKKLECGHIFHVFCLRSWFQRQQTCPTCRADVVAMRKNRSRQEQETPISPPQPQTSGQIPPAIPVFFSPPPMPVFTVPTSTMTVEQLKARERALLGEMEARMKCLESVRQCLDASLTQLKQCMEQAQISSQNR